MATHPSSSPGDIREPCPECGTETLHEVHVEIRTESRKQENAEFSREPYRVSTCVRCDAESVQRMNNA
jgi:formate dehydrogenase assembly factor FdhD